MVRHQMSRVVQSCQGWTGKKSCRMIPKGTNEEVWIGERHHGESVGVAAHTVPAVEEGGNKAPKKEKRCRSWRGDGSGRKAHPVTIGSGQSVPSSQREWNELTDLQSEVKMFHAKKVLRTRKT